MRNWKTAIAIALVLSACISIIPTGQSLSINHTGPVGVPSSPLNVRVVPGSNYVDVTWEEPEIRGDSPISAYLIYIVRDYNWTGEYPDDVDPIAVLGPEARSYRHSDLVNGDYYTYYLKAQNANGLSAYSPWVWARPGHTVPLPPELYGTIGNGKATLRWAAQEAGGTAVQGFHIYRGLSDTNMTIIGTTEGWSFWDGSTHGQTMFTDESLVNGVTYLYLVTAFNSMGESNRSNVVSIQPLLAPMNLTAFPNQVGNCDAVNIVVNWTFPAENISQIVGFGVIFNNAPIATVAKENTSYTFHVSGGWGYEFRISAIYIGGNESVSDPVRVSAPMCEGGGFGFDAFFLLIGFGAFVGIALVLAVIILLLRRRHKG